MSRILVRQPFCLPFPCAYRNVYHVEKSRLNIIRLNVGMSKGIMGFRLSW